MSGERNIRTGSARRCCLPPTARHEAAGEVFGHGRGTEVQETERHSLRLDELLDGGNRVGFPPAADDDVEIVRARLAGAEQVEARQVRGAGHHAERRHRNQCAAGAYGEHPQRGRPAQMAPPRVQPFPRKEGRGRAARAQQGIPFGPQRREAPRGIDDGHGRVRLQPHRRDGGERRHAAILRSRLETVRAT